MDLVSSQSSPTYANSYGASEFCVMISGVLNGCLLSQMISYFRHFRNDPLGFKVVIAAIWLGTAASFGCALWVIYDIGVIQHGSPVVAELEVPVGFAAAIGLQVMVHAMVQGVYMYRIYALGRRISLLAICCILVVAEIAVAFVWLGAAAHTMSVRQISQVDDHKTWFITSVLGLGALLDVILTISMCVQLRKSRTDGLKRTAHIVTTLTRWTIESGMITCIMALIALIVRVAADASSLWIGLGICLTSCYALALMLLVNGRAYLNVPHEFTLNSIPITTMLSHSRASKPPPPIEC